MSSCLASDDCSVVVLIVVPNTKNGSNGDKIKSLHESDTVDYDQANRTTITDSQKESLQIVVKIISPFVPVDCCVC